MLSPIGSHGMKSVIWGHCHLLAVCIHVDFCFVFPLVGEGGSETQKILKMCSGLHLCKMAKLDFTGDGQATPVSSIESQVCLELKLVESRFSDWVSQP